MTDNPLTNLRASYDAGKAQGIVSVCSAHPIVIEAALARAARRRTMALIEATCNQVNQDGGYTGMTPADFRRYVLDIADRVGLPHDRVILGGDHLGPNPWKSLPPQEAMQKACDMIAAYAEAGFVKLHLDASMGCAGEAAHLPDDIVAERAVMMAARAEAHAKIPPVYIIGTEIPTPGGATEALDHLAPTTPESVQATYRVHKTSFQAHIPQAWARVIGIVVQPGVEFGHDDVVFYDRGKATRLIRALGNMQGLIYEAHSTDYQPETALSQLVTDGFCILKVGPALTFALREALYGLDEIAQILDPARVSLKHVMEDIMCETPVYWRDHYGDDPAAQRILRHFSYSDRIRYYWPMPIAKKAVDALLESFHGQVLPETLVSQYLPRFYGRIIDGSLSNDVSAILIQSVQDVLDLYGRAARDSNN